MIQTLMRKNIVTAKANTNNFERVTLLDWQSLTDEFNSKAEKINFNGLYAFVLPINFSVFTHPFNAAHSTDNHFC